MKDQHFPPLIDQASIHVYVWGVSNYDSHSNVARYLFAGKTTDIFHTSTMSLVHPDTPNRSNPSKPVKQQTVTRDFV